MAIPPNAKKLTEPLDPYDLDKYGVTLKQDGVFLDVGESFTEFDLALSTEAITAGIILKTDQGYGTLLSGLELTFWLEVDPAMQGSVLFDGDGKEFAAQFSGKTNAPLPRRKQKTITFKVANQ